MGPRITLPDINPDKLKLRREPDEDFSPERNKRILNQVLAENDRMQTKMQSSVEKAAGNVADILASFAKYKLDRDGDKQLEPWLGKSWMTKLYGERLIEKLRMAESIRKDNLAKGNTLYNGYFYTK